MSSVKQLSFSVRYVLRTQSRLACGYSMIRAMQFSAVVFDFLDAREPLTTRYLPLKFQKLPYPLPTTSGRFTFLAVLILKPITAGYNNRNGAFNRNLVCKQAVSLA